MAVYIQSGGNPVPAAQAVAPASGIDAFGRGLQTGNQFVSEFVNREEQLDDIERKRRAEQLMLEDRAAEAYQRMLAEQGATPGATVGVDGTGGAAAPGGAFISPEVQAGLNMQAAAEQVAASDAEIYADALAARQTEEQAARAEGARLESWENDRTLIQNMFDDGILSSEEMEALKTIAPPLAAEAYSQMRRLPDDNTRIVQAAEQYFAEMDAATPRTFDPVAKPTGNPMEELGEPATFLPSPGKLVDFLRTSSKPELANMSPASREAFVQKYRQHYDKVQTKLKGMVLEAQQNALTERVDRVESMLIQQNSQFTRKRQMAPDALRSLAEAAVKGDDAMVKSLLSSVDANSRADLNRSVQWAQVNLAKRKYEEPREARRAASNAVNDVERLEEDLTAAISSGNSQDEAAIRAALQDAEVQREDAFAALDAHDPGSSEKYRKARQEEQELKDLGLAIEDREFALNDLEDIRSQVSATEQLLEKTRQEHEKEDAADLKEYGPTSAEYLQRQQGRREVSRQLQKDLAAQRTQQNRAEEIAREIDTTVNVLNRKSTRTFQTMEEVEAAKEKAGLAKRKTLAGIEKTEAEARQLKAKSDPEVIKRELEARLAKAKSETERAEIKLEIAKIERDTAKAKASGGGGDTKDLSVAQYYTAQSRVIKMLRPKDKTNQFTQLEARATTQQGRRQEANTFLNSDEAETNRGSQKYKDMVAQRKDADDALARIDIAVANLYREQSRSIDELVAESPGLKEAMIDINNDARKLGKTIPFPGQGFGATESPPPSVTETAEEVAVDDVDLSFLEDDPQTTSWPEPPRALVGELRARKLETLNMAWDGEKYVDPTGRFFSPKDLDLRYDNQNWVSAPTSSVRSR
jgi:hypothetical protein